MNKWILRTVAGLTLFIVTLLMTAPADLLKEQLTSNVPNLKILGTSGGFWSGQFQQVFYQNKSIKNVSWDLSPLSLTIGKLATDLNINDPLFNGDLSVATSFSQTIYLSEINGRQSVNNLASLWSTFRPLNLQGELSWNDVSLEISTSQFDQASGVIQWKDAALNIYGTALRLGTIDISLNTDNGDLLLTLNDDNSVLGLQGTLRFSIDKKYHLKATVKQDLPGNIRQAIQMFAKPDGNGRLSLTFSGHLK